MVHPNDIRGALIFTNDRGEVVFVNRHFLRMMNYSPDTDVIGEPMDSVMQLGEGITAEMASRVQSGHAKAEILLHLHVNREVPNYVLCTSEGAFDGSGTYIGLNFSFREISDPSRLTDIPNIHIDPDGAASDDSALEYATMPPAARYVTHQVDALRIFLARIIGISTRQRMDEMMIEAIQTHSWAAQFTEGSLHFDSERATSETYQGILAAAIDYTVDIVGRKWTLRELMTSEAALASEDVATAEDLGLREFLHRQ